MGTERYRHERRRGRLGAHLGIDEWSVRKSFVYATVFSAPTRAWSSTWPRPRRSAVLFSLSLYSHAERAGAGGDDRLRRPNRIAAQVLLPNALVVADPFHLHRRVRLEAIDGRPGCVMELGVRRPWRDGQVLLEVGARNVNQTLRER